MEELNLQLDCPRMSALMFVLDRSFIFSEILPDKCNSMFNIEYYGYSVIIKLKSVAQQPTDEYKYMEIITIKLRLSSEQSV